MLQLVSSVARKCVKSAVGIGLIGALAGCGLLHLHRPSEEKQARAASEGFKNIKLDAAITTARENADTLVASELETRRKFGEVLVQRDLLSVIAFTPTPTPATDETLPRGWPKLVKETDDALGKYGIVVNAGDDPGVADLRLITRRLESADNLVLELRVYDSLVATYALGDPKKVLSTECPPKDLPTTRPDALDVGVWDYYQANIVPACRRVQKARAEGQRLEQVLRRNPAYIEVAGEITRLEQLVQVSGTLAKGLAEPYERAKKQLTEAEARLAKRTASKEKDQTQLEAAQADVKTAVTGLNSALDAAKSIPLLDAIVKNDLLSEVVANGKFLSGDKTTGAHQTTKELVAALKRYPDIAERLRAAQDPGVNVFLLELALQRLEYQKLVSEQAAAQDVLTILRAKRETLIEAAAAWGRVKEQLARPVTEFPQTVRDRLAREKVGAVLSADSPAVREAVVNYAAAKILEDVELPVFTLKLADRYYRMSLNFSETALQARSDLIRAPLQEITAYHEGGIRSEEVAALLQALGVGSIAVGVNR